ncbi:MAG: hypothetical protein LAT75_03730 [Candidatus Cyclonatronum sp.]|uniref:hypothetical protein n=1 Tax=Cyclonatronum sp. TaxID=3024185 RepID=UPI0025C6FA2E|nr:hypothetical protein [Cyclonatronum sp.]MCC5933608.1 hypothetical protein [Balneolales bacterium]MCH8485948.1 hypothetical protein [Cyclonatronum sp.]
MQVDKNKSEQEYFELSDIDAQNSINDGVMADELSMSKIVFWSVATSVVVVILIAIAFNLYKYWKFETQFQQAVNTEYQELNNHRSQSLEQLNSFEVVDEQTGIFQIPIDSAKTILINERKQ